MPPTVQESADSKNSFVDLSGVDSSAFSNPYDALIEACNDEPVGQTSLTVPTFYSILEA